MVCSGICASAWWTYVSSGSEVSKSIRRIFWTPMRAATKIGEGTDLSVAMMAWGRNSKLDPAAPRTLRLEGDLGNVPLPRLGERFDALRTRFVADRPHPT